MKHRAVQKRPEKDWHKTLPTHEFYAVSDDGDIYCIHEYCEYWFSTSPFGVGIVDGSVHYRTDDNIPVKKVNNKNFTICDWNKKPVRLKRIA